MAQLMDQPMRKLLLTLIVLVTFTIYAQENTNQPPALNYIAKVGNGTGIPHPASKKTYEVTDGGHRFAVPENMVYVPAGEFTFGAGPAARKVHLDGYCIGKFSVTNAEYKAFLDATDSKRFPSYWADGTYPQGKANHPVGYG